MSKQPISLTLAKISNSIDMLSEKLGQAIAWLVLLMVLVVCYDVTMRYFFHSGSIAIQELEWHLFSIILLFGAGYTLKYDDHVRLELLYKSKYMNDLRRAWVNLIGTLIFLIPFCLLIIICSWPFVQQSFLYAEVSPDPGGLAYRWIIKTAIPLGFTFLLIQGFGIFLKNLTVVLNLDSTIDR